MASKEIAKILITGPFASGKTTLIKFVSEEQFSGKEVQTSDILSRYKAMTTVGLDFGILHVDEMLDVHLFGTPGQARFNFMWDILAKGALGTIFLIDSTSDRAISEAQKMLAFFRSKSDLPIIIGATKQDLPEAKSLAELTEALDIQQDPLIPCDVRKKEDSKVLILSLLQEIITRAAAQDLSDDNLDQLNNSEELDLL